MANQSSISDAPLILAFDTTSQRRSVAVARGPQILGFFGVDAAATHSWQLHDEIDVLLNKLGLGLEQMDAFSVTIGPGSFTGLRIGLATIKGFAHSLNKPVVGVSTLQAQARAAGVSGLVCACLDALRGEVYAQLFQVNPDGSVEPLTEPSLALPSQVYASLVNESVVTFVGDGVLASLEVLRDEAATIGRKVMLSAVAPPPDEGWVVIQRRDFLAPAVAWLTEFELQQGRARNAAELAALYVRPPDAEAKRRDK
jgi:tRNA threonylcarbamoyladenosine biosynthesis protein TsaB